MANKYVTRTTSSVSPTAKQINLDYFNNMFDDIYNNNVKLTTTNKLKKIDNELSSSPHFTARVHLSHKADGMTRSTCAVSRRTP